MLIDAAIMTMPRCAATLVGSLATVWSITAPSIGSLRQLPRYRPTMPKVKPVTNCNLPSGRCRDEPTDEYDRAAWHVCRGAALGLQTDRKRRVHEVGGGCRGAPSRGRRLRLGDEPQRARRRRSSLSQPKLIASSRCWSNRGGSNLDRVRRQIEGHHKAWRARGSCALVRRGPPSVPMQFRNKCRWRAGRVLKEPDHDQRKARRQRARTDGQSSPAPSAPTQRGRLCPLDRLAPLPPDPLGDGRIEVRRRLDPRHSISERPETSLPILDGFTQCHIPPAAGSDLRPLGRAERSDHVLRGQSVNVVVISHWPRQSLSWARLRRSHVFTVDTGRLIRPAISSLVMP